MNSLLIVVLFLCLVYQRLFWLMDSTGPSPLLLISPVRCLTYWIVFSVDMHQPGFSFLIQIFSFSVLTGWDFFYFSKLKYYFVDIGGSFKSAQHKGMTRPLAFMYQCIFLIFIQFNYSSFTCASLMIVYHCMISKNGL